MPSLRWFSSTQAPRSHTHSLSGFRTALQLIFVSLNELISKSGLLIQTTDFRLGAIGTPSTLALSPLAASVATGTNLSALPGDGGEREANVEEIAEDRDSHQRPIEALPITTTAAAVSALAGPRVGSAAKNETR